MTLLVNSLKLVEMEGEEYLVDMWTLASKIVLISLRHTGQTTWRLLYFLSQGDINADSQISSVHQIKCLPPRKLFRLLRSSVTLTVQKQCKKIITFETA